MGHHRPLQPTPPRRQAKDFIPKSRSEHRSLPHNDPDACNGGATAALPKLNPIGSRIGETHLGLDVRGNALGVAIPPGDCWCRSHDALKDQIYVDCRALGLDLQRGNAAYSLVTKAPKVARRTRNLASRNVVCNQSFPT